MILHVVKDFSSVLVSMEVLLWMQVINLIRISKPLWVAVSRLW